MKWLQYYSPIQEIRRGRSGRRQILGPKNIYEGPKCPLLGGGASLNEGPKCLYKKRPKCLIGAKVVGAEVVGAELCKTCRQQRFMCEYVEFVYFIVNPPLSDYAKPKIIHI